MENTMDTFGSLLKQVKNINFVEKEMTIFDLGGRGYFENPLSDILSFYCDPEKPHKLRDTILRALLECVQFKTKVAILDNSLDALNLINPPSREVPTNNGKRIDLLLEGKSWAVVIENKVYAKQDNPFKDYKSFFDEKLKKKKPIYAILSLSKINTPEGWVNITYKELIVKINESIKNIDNSTKWAVVLIDLLVHLKNLIGEKKMEKEHSDFVLKNYKEVSKIVELREQFFKSIANKFKEILMEENKRDQISIGSKENWGKQGTALRFKTNNWSPSKDIVLVVKPDGHLFIQFNIFNISQDKKSILDEHFKSLETVWEEFDRQSKTILSYRMSDVVTIEDAINQFKNVVRSLNLLRQN